MNIIYNNYKFNKHSNAILYSMKNNLKEETFTIVPVLSNRSGTKKAVLTEIKKMLEKKIIKESENEMRRGDYYVHPTFKKIYDSINFKEVKPYPKKLNEKALKILSMIANKSDRVIGREMSYANSISTRETRNEFRNFQSIFKEILFPADLIDIFRLNVKDGEHIFEKKDTTIIYSSDYEHRENLYKSQLSGFLDITEKGLSALEENGIYIFYTNENISNIDYSIEENYLKKLLKENDFKNIEIKEVKFNNNKEVKFILESKKIKEQIDFIKLLRKDSQENKIKINFL